MPSMVLKRPGRAHRPDQRQVAAGDDRDEGLGDVDDAERGVGADDGRQHRAGEPRERRAEGEGQHVDEAAVHAERGRDRRVLHRAAHDQPVAGEAPEGIDRAQQGHGNRHHHEAVDGEPEGAHLHVAERGGHALGLRPENRGDAAHQQQAQPPGGEQRVDDAAVEPLDDESLDDDAEEPDGERRQDEREPEIDPGMAAERAEVGAEHEELALRQVDHPHHPEDDREPEADQDEDREGKADLEEIIRDLIQPSPPPPRPGAPGPNTHLRTWDSPPATALAADGPGVRTTRPSS